MATVLVNGAEAAFTRGAKTLGELLEMVDGHCAERGALVTAVRLDGVDQPAPRDPGLAVLSLAGDRRVEIDTAEINGLLRAALDVAVVAVDALGAAADRLGLAFRGADLSAANHDLADFAQSLGSLVAVTHTVATASFVDLAAVKDDTASAMDMLDDLSARTETLIGAQQTGDWITVADVIEYDISSTLRRWPAVLATLRDAVPASHAAAL